ncbi:MAG: hypothetical protein WBH09_00335 [Rugosibacter sp.]
MPVSRSSPEVTFANEFLKHYLKGGIGAMPKSDIDALVMHLLDKHASENGSPLGSFPNQIASERLRAPLARIKRLRYEGSLKFGGRPEDEARIRFVRSLEKAGLELDNKEGTITKIVFVVEDILAKNWIQGQIKEHSGIFDGSFNTEIIKVDPELFFRLLRTLLPDSKVDTFEEKYKALVKKTKREELVSGFKSLMSSFVEGAAEAGGAATITALLALPLIGG